MTDQQTANQQQLDQLMQQIADEQSSSELAVQASQLVVGNGDPDPQLVLIGEAPGKQEDRSGIPFVGASGKLLDELLASIGLTRKDVYVTNIVKYRPPNNRDPSTTEKQQFLDYLLRELAILDPKVIVTLGRHALNTFLPNLKISQVHGELQAEEQPVVLPLYHPAAALYNGSLRQTLFDDFALLKQLIQDKPNKI